MKISIRFTGLILCLATFVNAQVVTNYTTADGLVSNVINCIFLDEGDVYFGTQQGVSFFDGTDWSTINQDNSPGLVDNDITAVLVNYDNDPGGEFWFGTNFGISQTDEGGIDWNNYDEDNGLGGDRIRFLGKDNEGNIWAGTSKGASVFDGASWQNFGMLQGIPFGGVNHIDFNSDGSKWLSTGLGGVVVMDSNNEVVNSIIEINGLLNNKVRAIATDDANNKWVATSDGITVINAQNMVSDYHTRPYTLPPPDTLNPVEDIAINSNGCVWAGIYVDYLVTVGGVSLWNGVEWMEFDESNGLIGPVIKCLEVDANDDVWVGTSTGVSKIEQACTFITSTREPKIEIAFDIFPNPVANTLNIKWSDDMTSKISDIKLYNTSMQLMGIYPIGSFQNELQIDVSSFSDGVYFIKVGDSLKTFVRNK